MTDYTVVIEAGNADATIWQSVAPSEHVTSDDGAEDVAKQTALNQDIADGEHWRVRVWEGHDADQGGSPTAEIYNDQL